jgi:oxygen-independent coproporphyrinogen-3 oxidase
LAGIYLHIPFCRRKCHYCNFFSQASLKYRLPLLEALGEETFLQRDYLAGKPVRSVYLGGGTPSILEPDEIGKLLSAIRGTYAVEADAEITIEVNPDDVTPAVLAAYREAGINRISIGVQSFFDEDLDYLNRIHNGQQSALCIRQVQEAGFTNISADLIFGFPTLTGSRFEENLRRLVDFNIPHISAYALTVEPKTALDVLIRKKKLPAPVEEDVVSHFRILMRVMKENGYEQYEISNFCKNGLYSFHNSNYWKGEHYLGLGPSAHSFNGISRQWNIASVIQYCEMIRRKERHYETELLAPEQQYNEYVMVSLRTMWGCSLDTIRQEFGEEIAARTSQIADRFIRSGLLREQDRIYFLTDEGKIFADRIAMELFADE